MSTFACSQFSEVSYWSHDIDIQIKYSNFFKISIWLLLFKNYFYFMFLWLIISFSLISCDSFTKSSLGILICSMRFMLITTDGIYFHSLWIFNSAVKQLIASKINVYLHICVCVHCVYLLCIYIFTHSISWKYFHVYIYINLIYNI